MRIKNKLKQNKFIYSLNAAVKSWAMKSSIRKLEHRYSHLCQEINCSPGKVPEMVSARLAERGIALSPKEKLNIFWVGTNLAQDTSGFLQALGKFGTVVTFKNFQGMYGLEFPTSTYNEAVKARNSELLLQQVEKLEREASRPDILIGQMWSNFISVEVLKQIQRKGIVTVNISMDDRLPELWQHKNGELLGAIGLVAGIDLTLTTSEECVKRFIYHGGPALYWPLASDPNIFKPSTEKDIDVSFVGNKYGTRGEIIRKLQDAGVKVEPFGGGWPNGSVGSEKSAEIFSRSKIILGVGTIGYCTDVYTLKLRDFDATMAGALYLTHRNPDLVHLFQEGQEIEYYSDFDEAVRKVKYYLAHPEKVEVISKNAAAKAREYHTWEKRLTDLFVLLGLKGDL